jgi:hypothetical protein
MAPIISTHAAAIPLGAPAAMRARHELKQQIVWYTERDYVGVD